MHDYIRSCMIVCNCVQFSADLCIMQENRTCTNYLQKSINSYMRGFILRTIESAQMCGCTSYLKFIIYLLYIYYIYINVYVHYIMHYKYY